MLHAELGHVERLPHGMPYPQGSLIIKELLDLGYSVSLFTLSRDVKAPMTIRGQRLTVHVGRYRCAHRARDLFSTEIGDLVSLMQSDPCDVYGAQWLYEFALAGIRAKVPLVITVHDWPLKVLRYHFTPYRMARLLMAGMALAQHRGDLVAVSPYIADALRRMTGRTAIVIPNGIEGRAIAENPVDRDSRQNLLVAVANGFDSLKNTTTLMRAYAQNCEDVRDTRLHIIGAGHEPHGAAHTWAQTHGLADGVQFLGPLPYEETLSRIANAVAMVHPSREESFGRTLIEAMAQGTPVIGGMQSGAVPWVLDGGRAGLLVDVTSVDELSRSMRSVLTDRALWVALSQSGQTAVKSRFSLATTTGAYLDVLRAAKLTTFASQ